MTQRGPSAEVGRMLQLRLVIGAAGVLVGLVGVMAFLDRVAVVHWPRVGLWLAGGVVVHDAVLAPAAVILGLLVLRRVPLRTRPALRVALLGAATVVIIGLPLFVTR